MGFAVADAERAVGVAVCLKLRMVAHLFVRIRQTGLFFAQIARRGDATLCLVPPDSET